jgi:hypothetical protein
MPDSCEVVVSAPVATSIVGALAAKAEHLARDRWQRELAAWLQARAGGIGAGRVFDMEEVAWTPDHFAEQQLFLLSLVQACGDEASEYEAAVFRALAALVSGYRRSWVVFGRRWVWPPGSSPRSI